MLGMMLTVPERSKEYMTPGFQELNVLWAINKSNMQKNSNKGHVQGGGEVEEAEAFLQLDSGAWLFPVVWLQNKPLVYGVSYRLLTYTVDDITLTTHYGPWSNKWTSLRNKSNWGCYLGLPLFLFMFNWV